MKSCSHEIRYQSLANADTALCFPCDAMGRVTMDDLSDPVRNLYFFARTLVGSVYARAVVMPAGASSAVTSH